MASSAPDAPASGPASPALQVIVLGSGGGPQEFNTTAFLVRSTAEGWRRGSLVALDAGVLLSSITRILEQSLPPGLGAAASTPGGSESETPSEQPSSSSPPSSPPPPLPLPLPYTLTTGPFAGLEVPHASAAANASFVQSALVDTYLITHPHLDHISGFVINTAGLPGTRPKRLAGLPSTIAAIKTHIFNNVIWPNLSDENNGAGLVTFMRLVEGGSPALGDGDGRGYVEISDGLAVKIWGVSHGHCIERHSHRGSGTSTRFGSIDAGSGPLNAGLMSPHLATGFHGANGAVSTGGFAGFSQPASSSPLAQQQQTPTQSQVHQPQLQQQLQQQPVMPPLPPPPPPPQPQPLPQQSTPQLGPQRRDSLALLSGVGSVVAARRGSLSVLPPGPPQGESICVYDSSAYFLRDVKTGREVLMFGDVEPDSVSLSPRNVLVWQEAAPKIAAGHLAAIFVECSYDDAQPLDRLYGHLTPRFVAEEMASLAAEVRHARVVLKHQQAEQQQQQQRDREGRKRKRYAADDDRMSISNTSRTGSHSRRKTANTAGAAPAAADEAAAGKPADTAAAAPATDGPVSPRTVKPARVAIVPSAQSVPVPAVTAAPTSAAAASEGGGGGTQADTPHVSTPTAALSLGDADPPNGPASEEEPLPLRGLKVVIIHIKEKLRDGPPAGEIILNQLREHEARNPLGCEYIISFPGQSLFF